VKIDHLQLVRSREYAEVVADRVAVLPRGAVSTMTVLHEQDDSCCRLEPWGISLPRLLQIAGERRSLKTLLVALPSGPEGAPKP
jgi:hypothetical protein